MIKIVYAGNDKMFDGVLLSAISVVRRTKESVHFSLLTMDLSNENEAYKAFSDEHASIIDEAIKEISPESKFELIHCDELYHNVLKEKKNSNYTPFALLRLLIGDIPSLSGKVIYLDTDTMAYGDIKELYDIDMEGFELAACRDYLGKFWINPKYFNSGVLLMNVDEMRKTGMFKKVIETVLTKHLYFKDQSALNRCVSKLKYFPDEFRFNEQRSVKPNTVIKHFCQGIKWFPFFRVYNVKQWEIDEVHRFLKMKEFDDDFAVYKKIKDKMNPDILIVDHLVKQYGDVKAVNDISFKVKRGSLFAFLGINGAGKSTTINIIASILSKDAGTVTVDGFDLEKDRSEVKKRIGIVFQNSVLDGDLTVIDNLKTRSLFYPSTKEEREAKIKELIEILNLQPILKRRVGRLSGGQRRRVDIARSMLNSPELLILDEPTTGLDPKTRKDVWALIDKIRKEKNMTVFLTSHYLEEADGASDVIIMDHGNIIASGTPTELKNKYSHNYVIIYCEENDDMNSVLKGHKFEYEQDSKSYHVAFKTVSEALDFIEKHKSIIKDFEVKKGDMDDVFLKVTGRKAKKEEGGEE